MTAGTYTRAASGSCFISERGERSTPSARPSPPSGSTRAPDRVLAAAANRLAAGCLPAPRRVCAARRSRARSAAARALRADARRRVPNANEPTSRAVSRKTPVPRADGASVHSHSALRSRIELPHLHEADDRARRPRVIDVGERRPAARSRAARSISRCTASSVTGSSMPKRDASASDNDLDSGPISVSGRLAQRHGPPTESAARFASLARETFGSGDIARFFSATRRPSARLEQLQSQARHLA